MTSLPVADVAAVVAGQVSLPPTSDPLVQNVLRVIGLVVGAFLASSVAALIYRWYTRDLIPRPLAVLFGASVVALYLNTVGLFGDFVTGIDTAVFQLETVLFNTTSLLGAAVVSPVGRIVGDRVATDVFAVAGATELDADVSRLVRTVGRVKTVTLPDDIGDIEGYDPAIDAVKAQLSGKTLLFPRRLSEGELRDRLVERVKNDHGVGHVDVEFEDGDVSYLALGRRAAGLGPTLAPGTVAVAIHADPGPGAAAGDPVQVWSVPKDADEPAAVESSEETTGARGNGEETRIESDGGGATPSRVAFGELRGVSDDVATVALDEEDVDRLPGADEFRIVTLPADPRVDREFASLLRNADETMAATTVTSGATLDGRLVSDVDTTVVAIRPADTAVDAIPARSRELKAGDTLYVVGRPEVLRKVEQQATSDDNRTDGGEDEDDGSGGDSEGGASSREPADGTSGAQSS